MQIEYLHPNKINNYSKYFVLFNFNTFSFILVLQNNFSHSTLKIVL